MPADIGKFDDRPTHGEGVTFTHKRPDLPGEASRTFKGRIEGGQQVWDIQVPESTSGGGGGGSGLVIAARFSLLPIKHNSTSPLAWAAPARAEGYGSNSVYDLESVESLFRRDSSNHRHGGGHGSTHNNILFDYGYYPWNQDYTDLSNWTEAQGNPLPDYVWQEGDIFTIRDVYQRGQPNNNNAPTEVLERRMYPITNPSSPVEEGVYEKGVIRLIWYNAANDEPRRHRRIITVYRQGGGSGGSSTGAGEFLGRVDYINPSNGNQSNYINNPGASLPDPADLILPDVLASSTNALSFKNLTNNTYVIEGVPFIKHGISINDPGTQYYATLILPPQTELPVHGPGNWSMWQDAHGTTNATGGTQGVAGSSHGNRFVGPHEWHIYKGGGKEHSVDYIRAAYYDLSNSIASSGDQALYNSVGWPTNEVATGSKGWLGPIYIEGTAI